MGIVNRLGTVIVSKLSKIVEGMEDPREILDYSYEEQLTMLKAVKRGIVEVSASKQSLITQKGKLSSKVEQLEVQAKNAVTIERDDLATAALEKKEVLKLQVVDLETGIEQLQREESALIKTEQDIETKLELFKSKKEVLKAQYSAAESLSKINESVAGISGNMTDIGSSIERIQDKTDTMRSKATAIEDLMEKGVLSNVIGETRDKIDVELNKVQIQSNVKDELARLKGEIGGSSQSLIY
jgi:phage shock protein A